MVIEKRCHFYDLTKINKHTIFSKIPKEFTRKYADTMAIRFKFLKFIWFFLLRTFTWKKNNINLMEYFFLSLPLTNYQSVNVTSMSDTWNTIFYTRKYHIIRIVQLRTIKNVKCFMLILCWGKKLKRLFTQTNKCHVS